MVSARKVAAKDSLPAAARTSRVVYSSISLAGKRVRVSGLVLTPRAKAPKGGWPVVSFGHGTTGIADKCAPSKFPETQTNYNDTIRDPLWTGYLKAGYAIVQTDYEGLGTSGNHPFLIGRSEARGVLDVVRAARQLDRRVGKRVLLAGHSQGGHAVLWAASEAARWTPELELIGIQPLAPIGVASPLAAAREALTTPGGLSVYAGLVARAIDTVVPSFDVNDFFTDRALELYPQTLSRCSGELGKEDSFGSISVADMFRDDADGDALVGFVKRNVDVTDMSLRPRVFLIHGTGDTTVPVALSDALVDDLRKAGTKVTYKKYEGAGHSDVIRVARKALIADARRRLR